MTDPVRGQGAGAGTAVPSPLCIRPRPQVTADSGRATARAVLGEALSGVELNPVDRRFIARLSQWDKRSATTVASLIARARQAGRCEALTAGQLGTVLDALMDAFAYRTSGAASAGCWDCANRASGLCTDHARDADRAHAFAELAAGLAAAVAPAEAVTAATDQASHGSPVRPASPVGPAAPVVAGPPGVGSAAARPRLDAVPSYRRRRAAVAS
ncbi:MAG TPA: hypothetical protein VF843_08955 [Streptosporangiaceae bacterium]